MNNLKEGLKYDTEKLRYDLIPPEILEELAKVLTYGANKYEEHNWEKGMKWSRVFGALMRHMWSWWKGENVDPETGYSHLSHALCNIVFLVTYEQRKMKQFDDRFVGPESTEGRYLRYTPSGLISETDYQKWLISSCAYEQ